MAMSDPVDDTPDNFDKLKSAYERGWVAHTYHKARNSNPEKEELLRDAWFNGWDDAKESDWDDSKYL